MVLAGLTGLYCAGKNHIAALLEKRGIPVLDVDKLGRQALEREKAAVIQRFGEGLLNGEGLLDRRILARRVFGKKEELAALESIVHPAANALTLEWIEKQSASPAPADFRLCVINAALLHRSVVFENLEAIILVRSPFPVRLLRARKRDGLSFRELLQRFSRQKDFFAQYFSSNADIFIIDNPGLTKREGRPAGLAGERKLEKRLGEIFYEIRSRYEQGRPKR